MRWLGIVVFVALVSLGVGWLTLSTNLDAERTTASELRLEVLNNTPDMTAIEDICCGQLSGSFTELYNNILKTSYGGGPIWLKVILPETSGVIEFGNLVDKVVLYRVSPEGTISTSVSGDTVPTANRELIAPTIAFEISQVDTQGSLFLEVVMPVKTAIPIGFYSGEEFAGKLERKIVIHAALMGGIFVMVLYNFLVSALTRDPVFFFNACTILSLLFMDFYLSGIGAAYIWPDIPWISNYVLIGALGGAVAFGSHFAHIFLDLSTPTPERKWPLLQFFLPAALVSTGSLIILPYWAVQAILLVLVVMLLVVMFVITARRAFFGDIRARAFSLALLYCMVPGLLFVTAERIFGVGRGLVAPHLLEIILFFETLFISTILAYRIRITQDEINRTNQTLHQVQASKALDIINAIDRERKRIASDLHDTAGQGMLAIVNRLSHLAKTNDPKVDTQKEIKLTTEHSRAVIDEIRRISHDLHPSTLDYLGWHKAIEGLFDQLRDVEKIETRLLLNIEEDILNTNQQVHLYRILQELVSNIAKHAGAVHCEAELWLEDHIAKIEIRDNGQNRNVNASHGIGYAIVDQRVKSLGGKWQVKTGDAGTKISLEFPVAHGSDSTAREYP